MAKDKFPVTPATRFLKDNKIDFDQYEYEYEEKGGTKQSATELSVDEHSIIKTLIFSADGEIICMLMHGDYEVSTKELARQLGVKQVLQCDEKVATNATGYKFGGTSPFGTRKQIPVYIEKTILELERIYINGGKQGFIISVSPRIIINLLRAKEVSVALTK
jgi:Cys-tRNA(Pro) deacylase